MKVILEHGGLGTGGLNFDAKLRRESTDPSDLFFAHIGSIDAFARGLRIAARIKEEALLSNMVVARYSGWSDDLGAKIEGGGVDLESLEKVALAHGEPKHVSAQQEKYELVFSRYV